MLCVMFSGEDEDCEWYGDVLVRQEGDGYVIENMCSYKTWTDVRQFPNNHEALLSYLRTLLHTDKLVPLPPSKEQSSVGFLDETLGEYHPRHYAHNVRGSPSEV